MSGYLIFLRSDADRKAIHVSGYPWAAFVFAPLWAFRKGLFALGLILSVLYGLCGLLMVVATDGVVVGTALALWLGAFTAHNAAEWLVSSYEKNGYRLAGAVEARNAKVALRTYRQPKGHRVVMRAGTP